MTTSNWLFRVVLRAWPRPLRERHGRALAQVFVQSWREARGPDWLWERAALVADTIGAGWSERRAHRRSHDWSLSMRSFSSEMRAAWRALRARPLSTLAIVFTLGIGLGATDAMFAVMDAVLLRPLPYPRDGELLTMTERHVSRPLTGTSLPAVQEWAALDEIASIGAFEDNSGVLRSAVEPVRVDGVMTSPGFFQTLGVAPALGRTPLPGDPLIDPDPKIVLGDRLWREQFGARLDVVGEIVRIDNRAYTVVAVMPSAFEYPARATFWTTLGDSMKFGMTERSLRFLDVVARMKPGASVEAVNARLRNWAERVRGIDAKAMADYAPVARSVREEAVGAVRQPILITFAGVGILLLIACCNVAAMLLAQSRARERAMAVQVALGASRAQLVRQMLIEGLAMSAAAAAVGLLSAGLVRGAIVSLSLDQIPRIDLVQVDWRVVSFVVVVAVLATIVFALGPAFAASRADSGALMGRAARSVSGDRRRMLSALVATEFALALTLVAAAGLLINSYLQLTRVDLGFEPAGMAVARVSVPLGKPWNDVEERRRLYDDILARVRAVPGVTHAAFASKLPLEALRGSVDAWPAGRQDRRLPFVLQETSDGFVGAVGARLIEGREFDAGDRLDRPVVAMINDVVARHFWPGETPIGKTIEYDFMRGRVTAEVIGVIASMRYDGLQGASKPELYGTFRQGIVFPASLVFRTGSDPVTAVPSIRAAVREVDPTKSVTLDAVAAFGDRLSAQLARPRFFLALVGTFATIAFALAALGVYGTLSFWIAEHRRELGIRLSLGATRRNIAQLVVRRGLTVAGVGLTAGLLVTLGAGRYLQSLLFGVSAADPLTLTLAAAALGTVAIAACWLPARRAASVDPVEVLRRD